ncbi:MAG: heat shock protein HtpX [Chlamydiales bacterium]|jgi:heat shock protein HtpX
MHVMGWAKRFGLFILVNFLVIITLSIILRLFNIQPYITQYGIDYQALMAFCLVWGMGGAFISLAMSRIMAKWMMGVSVVEIDTRDPNLQNLVSTVHDLAKNAGLSTMPEVGIYRSMEVNAFATGPTRSRSLVAVSTGLLERMNKEEARGVLGHEIAHIANGDMVTMTLLQGIVNAFVMFLARAIAFAVMRGGKEREGQGSSYFAYYMTVIFLEVILMVLGSIVVRWFSRYREYRADAGGAQLAGRENMIAALQKLQATYGVQDKDSSQNAFQTMKISSSSSGFMRFFASHPPLEDRIQRLKEM